MVLGNSCKWSISTDHLSRTVITIHYGQLSFANVSASNTAKWENFEVFESSHVARIILRCLDLAKPVTKYFGPISSLTWRSRSRSSKSRSSTWRRIGVHSYQVSSKFDHKWRSYMDLKFRVFGTKMGLWPWKVGQGRWNWVTVLRSTWGPYLYRFLVCPLNFVWKERKNNN